MRLARFMVQQSPRPYPYADPRFRLYFSETIVERFRSRDSTHLNPGLLKCGTGLQLCIPGRQAAVSSIEANDSCL